MIMHATRPRTTTWWSDWKLVKREVVLRTQCTILCGQMVHCKGFVCLLAIEMKRLREVWRSCLWCSSSIPFWVASSLFSFSFLLNLRYTDFPCPRGVQGDSWGEILSVYQACHLELSPFLCQACHVTPLSSQNWKPTSSYLPTDLSFSFFCFHQTHD